MTRSRFIIGAFSSVGSIGSGGSDAVPQKLRDSAATVPMVKIIVAIIQMDRVPRSSHDMREIDCARQFAAYHAASDPSLSSCPGSRPTHGYSLELVWLLNSHPPK